MKQFLLLIIFIPCMALCGRAQYTLAGKIEYEKKTNVHALLQDGNDDESDNSWLERMKSTVPKFSSAFFDLIFDSSRSIYKPGKEVDNPNKMFGTPPASDNIILTDFNASAVKAIKNVYEQKFFVQDSMRKLKWVEKDELRTIADYKCHKAVSKICDSVYVVAFYTEDIPVSGGPEMFGGLPGMIMELAIPRLHTTWTADKIELISPAEADFKISEKGKKVTEKELSETIQSSLKSWGKWGTKYIWWTVL